ncbi:hypothetical protein [Kitasatospora sp. GAS204B]|uniref:hypothetical protein n=1 Tax=unclassified Kitasatospora TaxID=2633591 RepID=UPI0024761DBA|nr:hypothetical protein [Kitasatospora sp. GAS204B]MDH6116817.1 uncharacterized protein YukE [Kitasatospora sp. GAS204B]
MATSSKVDADVQSCINGLQEQVASMITHAQKIEQVTVDVETWFKSLAAQSFVGTMRDWNSTYGNLMTGFQSFLDATVHAQTVLNNAEDEAHAIGGNWGGNSLITKALGG